jgi:hypothetical protein
LAPEKDTFPSYSRTSVRRTFAAFFALVDETDGAFVLIALGAFVLLALGAFVLLALGAFMLLALGAFVLLDEGPLVLLDEGSLVLLDDLLLGGSEVLDDFSSRRTASLAVSTLLVSTRPGRYYNN